MKPLPFAQNVQSRHLTGWIEDESVWPGNPAFADEPIWREALEGLEPSPKVAGFDEVGEVLPEMESQLFGRQHEDCQDFRVLAGMTGNKEITCVPTQGASKSQR